MVRQFELVERVKAYDPAADEDALNRAYVFSMKAHGAQVRASGDPYFSHPLEVAGILSEYKLDCASIITALLHDTVEDTVATLDEIESQFGQEIARLVDGVTKLSRIEQQSVETRQAENFRKLVLAMSDDLRVLLVKLADRLHNMRTLRHIGNEEKRRRIAGETMEIYAPLCERIGMHRVRDELEDLAFRELNPEARESVTLRLEFLREIGGDLVPRIMEEVQRTLANAGTEATVSGREKSPYSIWRKMQRKRIEFEQLSDVMAFRIIVADIAACYQALGAIHLAYRVVPERFKDYISTPKLNGYRSLHTVVVGPEIERIEVQIRTQAMHEVAELGVAAHWAYKQDDAKTDGRKYRWLRELLDILEHAAGPEEFLENTKLEMYHDQVFCFTPKGDLIALPQGATPVDFAYAIHSEVGDACVGAKVNGRIVPLRATLQNGDQVEIVTSEEASPAPIWDTFVVTGKARARVRRFMRSQQHAQYINLGRSIIDTQFQQEGYEFSEENLGVVLDRYGAETVEDVYSKVGEGRLTGQEVVKAALPKGKSDRRWPSLGPLSLGWAKKDKDRDQPIPIKGLIPGMAIHYAGCCTPLLGDRIVGIITPGKGVTIHTIDCETLESLNDSPERWIDVTWDRDTDGNEPHLGRIIVTVENKPGSLGDISTVIGKNDGNITNLRFTNRAEDFFEMTIDVEVRDVRQLTQILAVLRAQPAVNSVERARG